MHVTFLDLCMLHHPYIYGKIALDSMNNFFMLCCIFNIFFYNVYLESVEWMILQISGAVDWYHGETHISLLTLCLEDLSFDECEMLKSSPSIVLEFISSHRSSSFIKHPALGVSVCNSYMPLSESLFIIKGFSFSFFLFIFSVLKSVLNLTLPACFWLVCAWNIFVHFATLKLYMLLLVTSVSYRYIGSCFTYLILSAYLCVLFGKFNIFNVKINIDVMIFLPFKTFSSVYFVVLWYFLWVLQCRVCMMKSIFHFYKLDSLKWLLLRLILLW